GADPCGHGNFALLLYRFLCACPSTPGRRGAGVLCRALAYKNLANRCCGGNMSLKDKCCTIVPYFKISTGNLGAFKELCRQMVAKTSEETKCLYYGFSFDA